MIELEERKVECPYCGEVIDVLIDCSVPHQYYIEDCQVCCRPIFVLLSYLRKHIVCIRVRSSVDIKLIENMRIER